MSVVIPHLQAKESKGEGKKQNFKSACRQHISGTQAIKNIYQLSSIFN